MEICLAEKNRNKEDPSEKYSKYLIGIIFNSNFYCTVSGMDQDKGSDDQYLSNGENVLLFSSFKDIRQYVIEGGKVFDQKNFKIWLKEIRIDTPYTTFDFDRIKSALALDWPREIGREGYDRFEFEEIFHFILFLEDINLMRREKINHKVLESVEIGKFKDFCYDNFVFVSNDNSSKLSMDSIQFKNDLKILFKQLPKLFLVVH